MQETPEQLVATIRARSVELPPQLRRVADFISGNPRAILDLSALAIAQEVGVSDASVVRTCSALGFDGLTGLRKVIAEAVGSRATQAGLLHEALHSVGTDAGGAIAMVLAHERRLITALQRDHVQRAMLQAVSALAGAQRIVVFGTGTSGYLAEYAAVTLARHGRPALTLRASGFSLADQMLSLAPGDALLMLFFGKPYPEAEAVMEEARACGMPVVMITENRHNALVEVEHVVIEVRRVGAPGTPLHGAALTCIEALIFGLAAVDEPRALEALGKLTAHRHRIARRKRDVAPRKDRSAPEP